MSSKFFGAAASTATAVDKSGSYHQNLTLLPLGAINNLLEGGVGFCSSYTLLSVSRNGTKVCECTKDFSGVEGVCKSYEKQ